ncbi:hypothetical protein [Methylobrevis pamukkalensis]|uniref:hypothetical protein n=1 Tax=Methylobrevis pamukkalensis TaxID=1439726 RepID=UPI00114D064A|nr:hypothetical protein [Methylobrevis pamukkalensis]
MQGYRRKIRDEDRRRLPILRQGLYGESEGQTECDRVVTMDEHNLAISVEDILHRASKFVTSGPPNGQRRLVGELAELVQSIRDREEAIRREAYLDGVRSAAKIVQERKEQQRSEVGEPMEGDDTAEQIRAVAETTPVSFEELQKLLRRVRRTPKARPGSTVTCCVPTTACSTMARRRLPTTSCRAACRAGRSTRPS